LGIRAFLQIMTPTGPYMAQTPMSMDQNSMYANANANVRPSVLPPPQPAKVHYLT